MIAEIGLETARELLNYAGTQDTADQNWEGQLKGAVALHNILVRHNFAYLADEVGMGKTRVALGAVALFRHFRPDWRVLYIAPRENLQRKWEKELRNFTADNWRVTDNRVRTYGDVPAYGLAICDNLTELAVEAARNPCRDFILRLTSFSFGLSLDKDQWKQKRDDLLDAIPNLREHWFSLRDKDEFKDSYARAINSVLPTFDLVVIDEGHNLKHGLQPGSANRNRLLAYVLGHPEGKKPPFSKYSRRFERALVLSATPLENDYGELWNQLYLLNSEAQWPILRDADPASLDLREASAGQFLIRRLTGLTIGEYRWTKNMYRREWRQGGTTQHDEPLRLADAKERLIVALVQKKVAEVLQDEKFKHAFQIGMLASFESFMETSNRVRERRANINPGNFDGQEQTDQQLEREGIDTPSINHLARSYSQTFAGQTLPHPKLDAVAETLKGAFDTGEKTLVFVRRVRSVDDLTEKLNRHYDQWIKEYLRVELPTAVLHDLEAIFRQYEADRLQRDQSRKAAQAARQADAETARAESATIDKDTQPEDEADQGSLDNFFAWFFRGEKGPKIYLSGANFNQKRLADEGSHYRIFFEDNYVLDLLGVDPQRRLAQALGQKLEVTEGQLRETAYQLFRSLSENKQFKPFRVFWAYQEAALVMLGQGAKDPQLKEHAQIIHQVRFGAKPIPSLPVPKNFPPPTKYFQRRTFFTELRQRPELCAALWPDGNERDFRANFVRREQRRELISYVARLGHPLIDLWILAIQLLGTLKISGLQRGEDQMDALIEAYLTRLEKQSTDSSYSAYYELSEVAKNFDLILDVNFPQISNLPLDQLSKQFRAGLAQQSPVAGISGSVKNTRRLVQQFRMPGYPLVVVSTDVLQEGEDLHTFCRQVMHYGISWTPSAMEQRTGRVDRLRSLTHRRLEGKTTIQPDEKLQVFYPHLRDTVEVLQVERVFERMNRFIRLMHRSLVPEASQDNRIHPDAEFVRPPKDTRPIDDRLTTRFDIDTEIDPHDSKALLHQHWPALTLTAGTEAERVLAHFQRLVVELLQVLVLEIEPAPNSWTILGTAFVEESGQLANQLPCQPACRRQPFTLFLHKATGFDQVLLRCVSPIGVVEQGDDEQIMRIWQVQRETQSGKLCAALDTKLRQYTLTIEQDIYFHHKTTQLREVEDLIHRVVASADRMEKALLGKDEPLDAFRDDLLREPERE